MFVFGLEASCLLSFFKVASLGLVLARLCAPLVGGVFSNLLVPAPSNTVALVPGSCSLGSGPGLCYWLSDLGL